MPFTVFGFQYQSGQSAKLPWTFAYGYFCSKPCRPCTAFELTFGFAAKVGEDTIVFCQYLPLRTFIRFFATQARHACHFIEGRYFSGRITSEGSFAQFACSVLFQMFINRFLRGFIGEVYCQYRVANILGVTVELREIFTDFQHHGFFRNIFRLFRITDTARFILHKDLCFTDGIILYFRSIRNDDLCLRL